MFSSNSVLLLPRPTVSRFRDGKITVCLTKPWSCEKWRVPNSLFLLLAVSETSGREQKKLGESLGSLPGPSSGGPAPGAQPLWGKAPLLPGELIWGCMLAFCVLCRPPTSLSSAHVELLYPRAPCAFGNELLCFPLEGQPHGEKAGFKPLFGPESYLVYFRRGCRFPLCQVLLASTQSQKHSTHSHSTWGKPFIHFICFFLWERSPNTWSVFRKSKRNTDSSCFANCQMNPFPPLASNVFHYGFNEIALTYLWSNKRKKDTL